MMTLQARESLRPVVGPHHPLRAYAVNSPRAKARLVVMALLADGSLDDREMAVLNHRGAFADMGISREDFVRVLYDFCGDVARQLPAGAGGYQLTPKALAGLFGEVAERNAREKLLRHIIAVISSDGQLSDGEECLFRAAIDHWKPEAGGMPLAVPPEPLHGR